MKKFIKGILCFLRFHDFFSLQRRRKGKEIIEKREREKEKEKMGKKEEKRERERKRKTEKKTFKL